MSIIDRIKADQLSARKAKDDVARSLLTTLMSEALMVAKNDGREAPTDDETTAVVRKFLKGNVEVQKVAQGDALAVAVREAELLNGYLPQQLTQDQLEAILQVAMQGGLNNVGALMGYLKANHAGLYDGKAASAIIKELLA